MIKINLGCGPITTPGWINVDYALGARLSKIPYFTLVNKTFQLFTSNWDKGIVIQDLNKKFQWNDNSVDILYSSHTLEHMSRQNGRNFMKECYRVLKHKGVLRIVVPDLQQIVYMYLNGIIQADHLLEELNAVYGKGKRGFKYYLSHIVEYPHQCMYDNPTLLKLFHDMGFEAHSLDPFESNISDIKIVEKTGRTKNAIIVEGIK